MKIFLAIFLWLCISSCFTFKPVEFRRTENFSVASNNNSPLLSFGIVFYNPNGFGCTVSDIESEGSLNGRLLFNAGIPTKVKAKGKSEISLPVTAKLAKMDLSQILGSGLNLLLNDEAIPMQVKGSIRISKFIFSKTYIFDYTERIDKAWMKKIF